MKKQFLLLVLSFSVMWACSDKETPEEKGIGYLTLNINQGTGLKADIQPEDFILSISDGGIEVLKERKGDLPGQIALPVGRYTVEAFSSVFSEPKFDMPCYSGKTEVDIVAGESNTATLTCAQSNAGIKIIWAPGFASTYQTYSAEVQCEAGYLVYSKTESRIGYFLPGTVSLKVSADGKTLSGGTITLAAKDMVTVTLSPKESPSGMLSVNITIDETVNEREIEITPEPSSEENSENNPYTIADAIAKQGKSEVWITGYIVGSKPSSGWDFITISGWQVTNIVLADVDTETNDSKCIPVELPTGSIRTNLNLVNHPELLHRKIVLKGNLIEYHSRPGLRNITTYSVK